MHLSPDLFREQARPRSGSANPERMRVAFWEWMIAGGGKYSRIRRDFRFRGFFPWDARREFGGSDDEGPLWTFNRFGSTRTALPDRRIVFVGGEHEDFYDPDFCIYNDLIVLTASDQIEIYGYPNEVFPPTDFHTATLVGDRLFLIGGLGYREARHPGQTPVHVAASSNYEISRLPASGDNRGWIYNHEATLTENTIITVKGGEVVSEREGKQVTLRNFDDYSLDVHSGLWRRETDCGWVQLHIRQTDGRFFVGRPPSIEDILPAGAALMGESAWNAEFTKAEIDGVPLSVCIGIVSIEIVVQAKIPNKMLLSIGEQIRVNTEFAVRARCILQTL